VPALRQHAPALIIGFSFMLVQNWAYSRVPLFIQRLLDEIVGTNQGSAILQHALFAVGFALVTGVCTYFMRRLITGASRHIEYELRDRLFRKLLGLGQDFYQQRATGDIISRCTNDLNDVRTLLGPGIMYVPNAISRLALFIPLLFSLHVTMTFVLIGVMTALIAINVLVIPRFRPLFRGVQEHVGAINDLAWQATTGITTVKLYSAEDAQVERFAARNRDYVRANMRVTRVRGVLWPVMLFVLGLMELVTLWFGGSAVINGEMSIGQLLQFTTMVGILTFPILSVGWVMSLMQQGVSAMERIEDILLAQPERRAGQIPTAAADGLEVTLRQVGYRHPGADSDAISGVDLQLVGGQVLGITGPVGSGKSTLVAVLAGMLRATAGEVLIDGRPLAELDLIAVRGRMACVPQEAFLFSMTVAENIAMGSEEPVDRDQVMRAAEAAAVATDIAAFPDGYEQIVGERGITLSGGQKQRVAIARALVRTLSGASDVLILDDALSSVDSDTETRILDALRALEARGESPASDLRPVAIVVVSQRTSALRLADRILVMDRGSVAEAGSHDELVARGGIYARMAQLQQLGKALV
jgi:ATP-binding cassette subfamily B multidrug efflux pump